VNCRDFTDFIMAWLDGELPEAQARAFAAHIDKCPPCVTYLEQYKQAVAAGRLCCGEPELPGEVPEALIQSILAARRHGGDKG
jgi:anti-sigma factor RsiW